MLRLKPSQCALFLLSSEELLDPVLFGLGVVLNLSIYPNELRKAQSLVDFGKDCLLLDSLSLVVKDFPD